MEPKVTPDPELAKELADRMEKTPEVRSLRQLEQINQTLPQAIRAIDTLRTSFKDPETNVYIQDIKGEDVAAILNVVAELEKALKAIPSSISVDTSPQVLKALDKLTSETVKAIKTIQPKVSLKAPDVHVAPTPVNVDVPPVDLTPVNKAVKGLEKAIGAIPGAFPTFDTSDLSAQLKQVIQVLAEVRDRKMPVPQMPTTVKVVNPDGTNISGGSGGGAITNDGTFAKETGGNLATIVNQQLFGLIPKVYDYISYTATSSTIDTYVYKAGGSGGTTAATLTVTWTDSTKTVLSTIART